MSYVEKADKERSGPRLVSIEAVRRICNFSGAVDALELEGTLKGLAAEYALLRDLDAKKLYLPAEGRSSNSLGSPAMVHRDVVLYAIEKGVLDTKVVPKEALTFFSMDPETQDRALKAITSGELAEGAGWQRKGLLENFATDAGISDKLPSVRQ